MALNVTNFMQGAPDPGIYGSFSKSQLAHQDLMAKELDNVFKRITNETAGEKNRADINNTKAQTGLFGEQTKWYGPKSQAEIGLHQAQSQKAALDAQKLKMILPYLQQAFGGAPVQNGQQSQDSLGLSTPSQPNFQQSGVQAQGGNIAPSAPNAQQAFGGQQGGGMPNNAMAQAVMAEALGLKPNTFLNDNGEMVSQYLPGQEPHVQKVGPNKYESKTMEQKAVHDQEYLTENAQRYESAVAQGRDLEIIDQMLADPRISETTGPLNQYIGKYFPDQDIQELQGTFDAVTGNLVMSMSKAFGPKFTDNDLKFVMNQKPNLADSAARNKGKTKVLRPLAKAAAEKSGLVDQYMTKFNMSRIQANQLADKDVDIRKIMDDLKKEASEAVKVVGNEMYLSKYKMSDIENTARLKGWTVEETKKRLKDLEKKK